jgi:hypothetical protein
MNIINNHFKKISIMKKVVSISIFLVFILALISSLNGQQKPQPGIHGTDLIIPFATGKIDSLNLTILGRDELMKVEKVICANKEYQITSFNFIAFVDTKTAVESIKSTNSWTSDIKNKIKKLKSGDKVWIESITAKGPDGKLTMLKNIVFKLK